MEIKIKTHEDIFIEGEGTILYLVNFIVEDSLYDSNVEMWLANNEDHLKSQIREIYFLADDEEDVEDQQNLDSDLDDRWGLTILHREMGEMMLEFENVS